MSPTWSRQVAEFARDQQAEYTYLTAHHVPGGVSVSKKKHDKAHDKVADKNLKGDDLTDQVKADENGTPIPDPRDLAPDLRTDETSEFADLPSPLGTEDKEATSGAQPPAGAGPDTPESAIDQPPKGLDEGAAESRIDVDASKSLVVTSKTLVDLRLRTLATKLSCSLSEALGTIVRLYLALDAGDLPDLSAEHLITWASHGGFSDLRVQAMWGALKTSGYLKKAKKGHFELTPFDAVLLPAEVPATDPTKSPDSPADK